MGKGRDQGLAPDMSGPVPDTSGPAQDTDAFARFEQGLREALARLYDPAYRPAACVGAVLGCEPQQGPEAIQTALLRAIEDLRPGPNVPPTARSKRVYNLLSGIYVQDLTQEEVAERAGITPRHLRRELPEAVHVLAVRLWESRAASAAPGCHIPGPEDLEAPPAGSEPSRWRSQVRQELASLHESSPASVTDVGEAIASVVALGSAMTASRGIGLVVEDAPPNLVAAIHPSVLRQVLISAIRQLVQCMMGGQIALTAQREGARVQVRIAGQPVTTKRTANDSLIQEILAAQGGSLSVHVDGDRTSFIVQLPSVDRVVLVVDDNPDMLHLYRRYVAGTRYHIVHTAQGKRVFELVESLAPAVIVLDVMLPDVDGWELLGHLHESPTTRSIPIVVCSVVREEDLALALGATAHLAKPVQRQRFLEALDRALDGNHGAS